MANYRYLIISTLILFNVVKAIDDGYKHEFEIFKKMFGKNYSSAKEEKLRLYNFLNF